VRVLPEGVYLTYLKQSGTRFELRGIAQSSTRVSAFMRNIDGSEWFSDPALQIVETRGRSAALGGAEFTLFANQRPRATPEEAAQGATVAAK
jgi:type IV pilus assembly protein PilN